MFKHATPITFDIGYIQKDRFFNIFINYKCYTSVEMNSLGIFSHTYFFKFYMLKFETVVKRYLTVNYEFEEGSCVVYTKAQYIQIAQHKSGTQCMY